LAPRQERKAALFNAQLLRKVRRTQAQDHDKVRRMQPALARHCALS